MLFCTLLFRGHHSWVECFFLEESPLKGVTLRVCGGWSSVPSARWDLMRISRSRAAAGRSGSNGAGPRVSCFINLGAEISSGDDTGLSAESVALSRGLGRQSPASRECLHLRGRGHPALACADNVVASHRGYPLWLPLHCLQRFIAS